MTFAKLILLMLHMCPPAFIYYIEMLPEIFKVY